MTTNSPTGLKLYKPLLWKFYFDKGIGLTSYVKYLFALLGFYSLQKDIPMEFLLFLGIAYAVFCLILGRLWCYFNLVDTETEITNIFNPFVKQVRHKLRL